MKDPVTAPICVVYDCSCQISKNYPSLSLEAGPPLINDLCSILFCFQVHKFGLTTDIEKTFLNVKLQEEDWDFTQFLWLSNPEDPESEFDVYCFKAVLFGSASSPFMPLFVYILVTKTQKQLKIWFRTYVYVDNGCATEESVVQYFTRAELIATSEANFNLRSWASNSP